VESEATATTEKGIEDMDEMTFQQKMQDLMARIKELPDAAATIDEANATGAISERRARIQASVGELQESLDYLRLSVKYLVFDLEATRRENRYLRRMLDQNNRDTQRRLEDDNEDLGEG
jgi:hypothetical protein